MKADRKDIVEMYLAGMTQTEIGKIVGLHRSSVYNHLRAAGVKNDDRKNSIMKRREYCKAGLHKMEKSARIDRYGARHCKECEAIRAFWREMGL